MISCKISSNPWYYVILWLAWAYLRHILHKLLNTCVSSCSDLFTSYNDIFKDYSCITKHRSFFYSSLDRKLCLIAKMWRCLYSCFKFKDSWKTCKCMLFSVVWLSLKKSIHKVLRGINKNFFELWVKDLDMTKHWISCQWWRTEWISLRTGFDGSMYKNWWIWNPKLRFWLLALLSEMRKLIAFW